MSTEKKPINTDAKKLNNEKLANANYTRNLDHDAIKQLAHELYIKKEEIKKKQTQE